MEPEDLYCLPLDEFVPERAALAKALRAEGRREEAAEVAKLPKPSVAAWAVNQVVRAQPQQATALWEAGDAVLATQERVFAGEAAGKELRAAIERQRAALEPLAEAARGLVAGSEKFLSEAHVQTVVETLHAAAVDPGAREDVAAARVARPLRLTGLEAIPTGPAPARRRAEEGEAKPVRGAAEAAGGARKTGGASKKVGGGGKQAATTRRRPDGDAESEATRARLAERDRRDKEVEAERRAAEKARTARLREAQRALGRAERDREAARTRVQKAVEVRDQAAVRVERAEAELLRAEGSRADAHAELEQAEDAVDRARAELDGLE